MDRHHNHVTIATAATNQQASFVPHVVRIADLLDRRYASTSDEDTPTQTCWPMKRDELLLTLNQIGQLRDLHGFFKTLSLASNRHRSSECVKMKPGDYLTSDVHQQSDKKLTAILEKIDRVIEMDFLDKIQR